MKLFPPSLRLLALTFSFAILSLGNTLAQQSREGAPAEKAKPRELAGFVQNLPKAELSKLRSNKAAEVAVELTQKLREAELGKEGTFLVKVGRVETIHAPDKTAPVWRIESQHDRIKAGSTALELWCFVSVETDPSGAVAKARPGQEFIVSGKITRSDIMIASGQPQLWVDIQASSVKTGK